MIRTHKVFYFHVILILDLIKTFLIKVSVVDGYSHSLGSKPACSSNSMKVCLSVTNPRGSIFIVVLRAIRVVVLVFGEIRMAVLKDFRFQFGQPLFYFFIVFDALSIHTRLNEDVCLLSQIFDQG